MMWWNGDANWWVWTVMILCMLAFWGLIAWVVVVVARSNKGTPSGRKPQDVLAERYARGEIEGDEYRRRLDDLRDRTAAQ